jgi:hypothetical protein
MKNALDHKWRDSLLARLGQLTPNSQRKWGRMDVAQMICHVTDPLRIAIGEMQAMDKSTLLTRTLLKWMVLAGVPAPKGRVKTFPEIDQAAGGGTPPASLDADRATLRSLLERIEERSRTGALERSPLFGKMTGRQFGRLTYVHLDHHLKQFGV